MMIGKGILRGLGDTLRHLIDTYIQDIKGGRRRYFTREGVESRRSKDAAGIFTVQYPEERLPTPEEFRYLPFLVYEEGENGEKNYRCTSCGICAKVCPPQCIWIERTTDPVTGRPVPQPKNFYIDVDICMNCGFCAEFCPFDAIKMDHDYELASYDRTSAHVYDMEKLGKPLSYWQTIAPTRAEEERLAREAGELAKAARRRR